MHQHKGGVVLLLDDALYQSCHSRESGNQPISLAKVPNLRKAHMDMLRWMRALPWRAKSYLSSLYALTRCRPTRHTRIASRTPLPTSSTPSWVNTCPAVAPTAQA